MNRSFFEDDEDLGVQGPAHRHSDRQHLGGGYGGGNFHDGGMQYDGARVFAREPDRHTHPSQGWAGSAVTQSVSSGTRGRMPKHYPRSDTRIQDDVWERLCHRHDLDLTDVSIKVEQGTVRLEGSVTYRAMKHRIENVAAECMGVQDVDNRIRVRRQDENASVLGTP